MFVKSAAKSQCSQRPPDQAGSLGSWLSVLVYFWFSYNTIFLSSVNQLRPSHFMLVERQQFLEFPVTSNESCYTVTLYFGAQRDWRGVRENNANRFLLKING